MHWQYNPYAMSLFIPTTVSAALAIYAWSRRLTPGAKPFAILMLAVATWSLEYALELGSNELAGKLFWARLQYVSIAVLPVAWFVFALQYTQRPTRLTPARLGFLSIVPIFTILLAWTNEYHSLFMSDVGLDTSGSFPIFTRTFALGFWLHTAYSYLMLFLGSYLLIQALARKPALYRGQSVALFVGAAIPWVGNGIYVFGLSPLPYFLDPTTFLFTLTGMAITWGIFRRRLLDIIPIAYETVIQSMGDGIPILDSLNRVLHLNPAAEQVSGKTAAESIGQPVEEVLSNLPELLAHCLDRHEGREVIHLKEGQSQKYFDLRISSLFSDGRITGRLVVLRDITEQEQLERQLQRAQKMEAIGTLAGGVAHDLNNILSGLVSYPELLLMDIPKDSSLRDPILTIKKSGERAAACVRDLLTLARRGVPVTEVLNLNNLVSNYLRSSELESLKFYHPEVRIETKLDPDLLNIYGSTVHLSKTIMNLVSNAAEAIKDNGRIQISTRNVYIDRPMRGYDRVQEGSYVLLSVSDTGIGISAENMERIFEPFYTKKQWEEVKPGLAWRWYGER